MVPSLRNRLALFVFIGVLTIPALSGNLRGLTHLLVCEEAVSRPFLVEILPDGQAIVASAHTIEADDAPLCGGLVVDLRAGIDGEELDLDVILANESTVPWAGTVSLDISTPNVGLVVPARAGRVEAGERSTVRLTMRLAKGVTDIDGTLLLGP